MPTDPKGEKLPADVLGNRRFESHRRSHFDILDEADEKGISAAVLHRSPGVSKIEPRKFKGRLPPSTPWGS